MGGKGSGRVCGTNECRTVNGVVHVGIDHGGRAYEMLIDEPDWRHVRPLVGIIGVSRGGGHHMGKDHTSRYVYGRGFLRDRGLNKKKRLVLIHHLIGCAGHDHINGDGLDNRRCNLRPSDDQNNSRNRRKSANKSSAYKGVSRQKGRRWVACITVNWKRVYLGAYDREIDAAKCYDNAARTLFGAAGTYNFPLAGEQPAQRSSYAD